MSSQQDELLSWKQKYYDAISDLEAREKQWGEVEQTLRQGLNRLSIAADDSDEELNRQLKALRNELNSGGSSDELERQLNAISESIRRLDEARREHVHLPTPGEFMGDVIGRIEFPLGMGEQLRTFKRRLEAGEEGELIDAFSALVTEALRRSAGAAEEGGLFSRLFGKEEGGPAAGLQLARALLADLVSALVEEESRRESLNQQLEESRNESELQQVERELIELLHTAAVEEGVPINEVLVQLLERLDVPNELGEKVEALKGMLAQELSEPELEQVIVAIANLVAEMRGRMQSEKAEIETFLKQLTTRLQEIDSGFKLSIASRRDSFRNGQALDDAVNEQVQGIEESVQQAEELSALKTLVQQRVDTIRNHMQEFRSSEAQRLAQSEKEVAELTEKLESVQGESAQLRERLQEEHRQSLIDPLTCIPNRLAYNERLKQEVARWQRYGTPLSIAVWDVDKFKSVNDTYGHQAGDKVLTAIGKLLNDKCRETDFVARFGGEEFVMLFPQTHVAQAMQAAEGLRRQVEALEFHFRGKRVPITISCGISEFGKDDNAEKAFERADKALYEAKHGGRNRCCQG